MKTLSLLRVLFCFLIVGASNLQVYAQESAESPAIIRKKVNSTDVDKITETVAAKVRLAAIKAILNTTNPVAYPLPADIQANEHKLKSSFTELPEKFKSRFTTNAKTAATPNGRLRSFGKQTQVNLNSNKAVSAQIAKVNFPAKINYVSPIAAAVSPITCSQSTKLSLSLNQVKCIRTTNDWGSEDEMYFSGFAVKPNGGIVKSATFKLGDFSNRTPSMVVSYFRKIYTFDIGSSGFPKKFNYVFIPVESDGGSVANFITAVVDLARKELEEYIPNIPITDLDDIVVDILSDVLNDITDFFFGNEVFNNIPITQNITSNKACLSGSSKTGEQFRTISKGFSGEYIYYWQWKLE